MGQPNRGTFADNLPEGPLFVDDSPRAGWWVAPIIFVVVGLLTVTRGSHPIWPFLFFWGISLAFVVHAFREPAISVSVGDAEATVTKHWPRSARVETFSLRELGPAVIIEDRHPEGGPRYQAAFALPGGRRVIFASDSNFEVISREVDRFRKRVRATEEPLSDPSGAAKQ